MTALTERKVSADATVSAWHAVALSESDTAIFDTTRALYVGVGGNIKVTMNSGAVVTFTGVLAGTILPVQVITLWTDTTATGIIGLY